MTWQLCKDSSQYLIDLWWSDDDKTHWQTAKKHFRLKGYRGEYLLIRTNRNGSFRVYNVTI